MFDIEYTVTCENVLDMELKDKTKLITNDEFLNSIVKKILPYCSDKLIYIERNYRENLFGIKIDNDILSFYFNDILIDVSGSTIEIDEIIYDNDIILDIFSLCDNIEEYKWENEDVCDFHKERYGSARYGPASRKFTRINKIIVKIDYGSCCCNYSG